MTLHEAMEKLFRQVRRPMTTKEIAEKLNENKWYQKADGSIITPYQIYGRAKNYPALFHREGSIIYLKGSETVEESISKKFSQQLVRINRISIKDTVLLGKILMNEQNFKSAKDVDGLIPHAPGLYCIRIKNIRLLPKSFASILMERGHNILYIGIASEDLYKRFLNQELRAQGHGTFFRSMGAVLGYRPQKGSLVGKKNQRNYSFSEADKLKIIEWINENLTVNWVEYVENFDALETDLIVKYLPLFNLAKNPMALQILSDLRKECVEIASRN